MNKLKLFALAITCFPLLAQAVDVYDNEYDKKGYVSFVMKQGEVSERVVELLNLMYPEYNVFFRQEVNGYLPSDLELSGESRETIAVEMLAGLGLSACVYENNIIELGKFKIKLSLRLSKIIVGSSLLKTLFLYFSPPINTLLPTLILGR